MLSEKIISEIIANLDFQLFVVLFLDIFCFQEIVKLFEMSLKRQIVLHFHMLSQVHSLLWDQSKIQLIFFNVDPSSEKTIFYGLYFSHHI